MNFQSYQIIQFPGLLVINSYTTSDRILGIFVEPKNTENPGNAVKIILHERNPMGLHLVVYSASQQYADCVIVYKTQQNNYLAEKHEIYLSGEFNPESLLQFGFRSTKQSIGQSLALAQPIGNRVYFDPPNNFIVLSGNSATVYYKNNLPTRERDSIVNRLIQLGKSIVELEIVSSNDSDIELSKKIENKIAGTLAEFFPKLVGGNNNVQ